MSESELDDLMGEVGGPCTFQGMVDMFQSKMAGDGNDPDELIIQAFSAYDQGGKIDVKMFQHALSTWGDKMTKAEIDDIFKEVEEKVEVVEEAPEEEGGDAKKKKKKKKKAAK